jgi:hypothetical protein
MHVFAVIDHPWEHSYNHALLRAVVNGYGRQAIRSMCSICTDQFDPVMRVEELAFIRRQILIRR